MKYLLTASLGLIIGFASCKRLDSASSNNKNKFMENSKTDTAIFGAGCFWCVEAVFQQLDGVLKVTSGYTGGQTVNPTYEEVCGKQTGHIEVTQIVFDPERISFDELLEVFWKTHDPTTPNQQGNDVGPQYQSAIFYNNETQKQKAEHYKNELEKACAFGNPIVTEIRPLERYYIAENHHQDYYANNTGQPYCRFVIQPKLEKLEKVFGSKLKKNKRAE